MIYMQLLAGTWFISALQQGTFLQFASGSPGSNLTTSSFTGGLNQQWQLEGNSSVCRVKNAQFGLYVVFPLEEQILYLVSEQEPMDWYIKPANGGYIFSESLLFTNSWNVEDGYPWNDNPVIEYPLDDLLDNSVWIFNSTGDAQASITSESSSASPSSISTMGSTTASATVVGNFTTPSNGLAASATSQRSFINIGAIVGGTVGCVIAVVVVVGLLCWWLGFCSRRGRFNFPKESTAITEGKHGGINDRAPDGRSRQNLVF
ncbi:hypothetical protein CERSUDRAFT_114770 [Gelatoporia subvermispora B]|uniref:Ricin B lectin domain-containing protein n=1 Tax=Ceriporiopsis subvermispora (strain B) TaxID=914234 RepID=M2REG5_CERS8|nr:hypothetical protein CERSUDRAFT_114770 [Gelatoporia subvermispora B]